jgi:hypothetical protein
MCGHTESCQSFFPQKVDLVHQGGNLRELEWSWLFTPSSLELMEPAYKWKEAGFMVLTIEPCSVPSLERSFQRKVKEANAWAGLKTYSPNNLLVTGTRLVFQEEVFFEQREVGRNPLEGLTQMDRNGNLKNGIRIMVDKLDLIMIKESVEEVVGREAKFTLEEERKHQNISHIGSRNVLPGGKTPLQNCMVREKMIHSKLADFILIHDRHLEKVRVRGSHGWEEESQQHKNGTSVKGKITGN